MERRSCLFVAGFAVLAAFAGFFFAVSVHAAAPSYSIEEKIALENYFARNIENIVIKLTGDRNVVVLVSIIDQGTAEQQRKQQEKELAEAFKQAANKDLLENTKVNVLPGIPKELPAKEIVIAPPAGISSPQMSRYPKSVRIIISKTVSQDMVKTIDAAVTDFVGLDGRRGDVLDIRRINFAPSIADSGTEAPFWSVKTLRSHINQLLLLVGLLLMALFLFGTVRSFMTSLAASLEVLKVQADTRSIGKFEMSPGRGLGPRGNGNAMLDANPVEQRALGGGVPALGNGQRHFDFINEGNISSLQYLLKNEKPDVIAIVLDYLPREHMNRILDALPEAVRLETLKHMAVVKQYHGDEIQTIENSLREKVNYLLGGPQNISELINLYDADVREKILADIGKEDPSIVAEIRRILVTMDDLRQLPKEHLYEVYKAVGSRLFAAALVGVGDELKDFVMNSLAEGARNMIKQEIDMMSSSIPPSRIDEAKKGIINAMKELETQGLIRIPREVP